MPPTPARLWGARDLACEATRIGTQKARHGRVADHVDRRRASTACRRSPAGPRTAARSSRCRSSTRSIPTARGRTSGMYRLQVHDAQTTGMHWQIGKGGGFHYQVAEARGEALPVTVFLGGPPALILAAIAPLPENVPELMLASLIAGERLKTIDGPRRAPAGRRRRVRAHRRGAAARAAARGPVRRSLRLLLAAPRLPGLPRAGARAPPRRDLPGHRRRQAAAGGLLHRRPAAGAAVAAVPARDARRRGALVVRRDRLPLARGGRRAGALRARGDGERLPDPRRGPALAHEVPARSPTAAST